MTDLASLVWPPATEQDHLKAKEVLEALPARILEANKAGLKKLVVMHLTPTDVTHVTKQPVPAGQARIVFDVLDMSTIKGWKVDLDACGEVGHYEIVLNKVEEPCVSQSPTSTGTESKDKLSAT